MVLAHFPMLSCQGSDEEIIESMVDWLTTRHLATDGGYPYDWVEIEGKFVIATVRSDGCETEIEVHTRESLLSWFLRAWSLHEEEGGDDVTMIDCLYETAEGSRAEQG